MVERGSDSRKLFSDLHVWAAHNGAVTQNQKHTLINKIRMLRQLTLESKERGVGGREAIFNHMDVG